MKKYGIAFLLALSSSTALALPPAVELDRLMLHAKMALDGNAYAEAAENLAGAQKLGVALPENFALNYATALNGLGKTAQAKEMLEKYLNKYGTKGPSYKPALALLVQIEGQQSGKAGAPVQPATTSGTAANQAVTGQGGMKSRVAARPQLPFDVSEEVWKVLEASEAYRNAPRPRPYKVSYQSSDQLEVKANMGRLFPGSTLPPTSQSGTVETTSAGDKCLMQHSTTSVSGTGTFTADNYVCGGFISLGATDGRQTTGVIKRIDELTGSLFPMRIGNQMTLRYQSAFLQDRRFDSKTTSSCQVAGQGSASELDPALKGTAWRIHCQQSYTSDYDSTPRMSETDDYYLEDLGVRLSSIGQFHEKKFLLPRPGTQTVQVTEGPHASRKTTTYTRYDWTVNQ